MSKYCMNKAMPVFFFFCSTATLKDIIMCNKLHSAFRCKCSHTHWEIKLQPCAEFYWNMNWIHTCLNCNQGAKYAVLVAVIQHWASCPQFKSHRLQKKASVVQWLFIYMYRGHVSECSATFVFCIVNIAPRAMVTLMSLLLFHTEHAKFSSACL